TSAPSHHGTSASLPDRFSNSRRSVAFPRPVSPELCRSDARYRDSLTAQIVLSSPSWKHVAALLIFARSRGVCCPPQTKFGMARILHFAFPEHLQIRLVRTLRRRP